MISTIGVPSRGSVRAVARLRSRSAARRRATGLRRSVRARTAGIAAPWRCSAASGIAVVAVRRRAVFGLVAQQPVLLATAVADVRDRSGRRRPALEAVDEADRADRAGLGAAVLRLPAELAGVDDARQPADAGLDRRPDQRVQPARQHGRPVRRHRADCRHGAADRSAAGGGAARGRSPKRSISRSCSARPAASSSTTSTRRRSSWATAAACCSASASPR